MKARMSVARWIVAALALLVAGSVTAVPATAAAESLAIAVDPDPVIDRPASITVTGTADAGRTLSIYAVERFDSGRCSAQRSVQSTIVAPAFGEPVAAGSIERTFTVTPADVYATRICARLHRTPGS